MTRVLGLLIVVGLAILVRLVMPGGGDGASAAMPLGFVLVASFLLGGLAPKVGLPAITGYLLVGMVFGPYLLPLIHPKLITLAILDANAVSSLRLLDAVALGLIALTAGGELRLDSIRKNLKVILGVLTGQLVWVFFGTVALGWLLRDQAELFQGLSTEAILAAILLLGAMATANSPATTLAVIQEYNAKGPVSETVLAVTVVKDVVVISLFTIVLSLAILLVRPESTWSWAFMAQLAWEVTGSLGVGLLLGWMVAFYLERWGHEMPLLILVTAFIAVTLLPALHLSGVLALMAAGFYIENFSLHGDGLIKAIERHALPVYVVFFTITGAGLDLTALATTLPFALALASGRMVFTALGTGMGGVLTGAPSAMNRHGWSGFVAQAGVTLGFAIMVEQRFPEIGGIVKTITLSLVAVNQLAGPVLFRIGLYLSGEIPTEGVVQEGEAPSVAPGDPKEAENRSGNNS